MFKDHSVHVIATYALLLLASPLIFATGANAQAVACPAGYFCTPVNSAAQNTTFNNGYYYGSGGYTGTTVSSPSTPSPSAPSIPAAIPVVNPLTLAPDDGCRFYSTDLILGSRGADVVSLQRFLISRGHSIPSVANGNTAFGYFGYQTASALNQYQLANGINENGYFGPITRSIVNAACGYPSGPGPVTTNPGNQISLLVSSVGMPTITREAVNIGYSGQESIRYVVTYQVQLTASGDDIQIGLPGSNFPAVTTDSFKIYQNGVANIPTSNYNPLVSYTMPSGTAYGPNNSFVVQRNQTVTMPVTIHFTIVSPGSNVHGVSMNQLFWSTTGGKASTQLVGAGWSTANLGGTTNPSPTTSTVPTQSISWSGGNGRVQIGLVDQRFESSGVILGWIDLNGASSGSINWDRQTVTDLSTTVRWQVSSLSQGPFRILAVSAGSTGNYCTSGSGGCHFVLSNYFTLSGTSPISVAFPSIAVTNTSTQLAATCTGASFNTSSYGVTWQAQASGGRAPYQYSWSAYGDISSYSGGSTQSQTFTANYANSGTKQAVARVTDSAGASVTATCSSVIPARTTTTTTNTDTTTTVARPSTTLNVTPSSMSVGGTISFNSTTVSPSSSMKNAAVDMSTDNITWMSGGPGNMWYWSNNTGAALGSYVIYGSFSPANPGTYYFRSRGTDNAGASEFVYRSVTVTAAATQTPPPTPPLSATCSGSSAGTLSLYWTASATGGSAPYRYSWSVYNDVSTYVSGSTQSASFTAAYGTSGSKQALARVTDSNGTSVSANCSANIPSNTASTPTSAASQLPSTTFGVSPTSGVVGQALSLMSITSSPTGTLKAAAIDMSRDNVTWLSGSPCPYWNSSTGRDSTHTISCTYTPTSAGTYHFRSRGVDGAGYSEFKSQTVIVREQ